MTTVKAPTETIRADDFVEYFLFPDLSQSNGIDSGNNNASDSLEQIRTRITEESNKFIGDYIWHKDRFQLIVKSDNLKLTNDNDEEGACVNGRFPLLKLRNLIFNILSFAVILQKSFRRICTASLFTGKTSRMNGSLSNCCCI